MKTVTLDVLNDKALHLLKDLEMLNWIKVRKEKASSAKTKLSDKYKGIITKEQGQELDVHIKQMRSEWENI